MSSLPSPLPSALDTERPAATSYVLAPPGGKRHFRDYSHDALIDAMIANPGATTKDFAAMFGRSPQWVRIVVRTDAFRARFSARNAGVADPLLEEEVKARFEGAMLRSLEVLAEKLEKPADQVSDALVLKAIELGAKAGSVGGFSNQPVAPPPREHPDERLRRLAANLTGIGAGLAGEVVDVQARDVAAGPAAPTTP